MPHYSKDVMLERKESFDKQVLDWPEVSEARMFGSPGYRALGTLFCFLVDDGIVTTKLPESERDAPLSEGKCKIFRGENKSVRNWLVFNFRSPEDLESALLFVRKSYESAMTETTNRD